MRKLHRPGLMPNHRLDHPHHMHHMHHKACRPRLPIEGHFPRLGHTAR